MIALLGSVLLVGRAWQADDVPETVARGQVVWQRWGCEGCHTVLGMGGGYAPDLTRIVGQRGESYLREFFVNPNAFHPDQRIMPRFNVSVGETSDLLAFLAWVEASTAGDLFPPRMIRVSGGGTMGVVEADEGANPVGLSDIEIGQRIFSQRCSSCHSVEEGVVLTGPSLANIAVEGANRVAGESAEDYVRNSILHPGDYLVEGFADVMQKNFAELVSSEDLDRLVAYVMTLNGGGE